MSGVITAAPLVVGALSTAGWTVSACTVWRLHRQLRTDRLTGLPNREALIREFKRLTGRRRYGAVGVVLLDLDGFKQVNDTHGHETGNAALRQVADRLTVAARPWRGLPVRLHGDEFAVLLPGLPLTAGVDMAHCCAAEFAKAIRTPLWAGADLVVSASAGAAVAPVKRADLSALLRAADQRMYSDKRRTSAAEDAAAVTATSREISHENNNVALAGTRAVEGHRG